MVYPTDPPGRWFLFQLRGILAHENAPGIFEGNRDRFLSVSIRSVWKRARRQSLYSGGKLQRCGEARGIMMSVIPVL